MMNLADILHGSTYSLEMAMLTSNLQQPLASFHRVRVSALSLF